MLPQLIIGGPDLVTAGKILQLLHHQEFPPHFIFHPSTPMEKAQTLLNSLPLLPTSLQSHFFIQTSGTTGGSKWIALSKELFEYHCEFLKDTFKLNSSDTWKLGLPLSSVGGLAIVMRAYFLSLQLTVADDFNCHSLTPTQLLKPLISTRPNKLTLIGGAPLFQGAKEQIPHQPHLTTGAIMQTYALSETASLVAIKDYREPTYRVLPGTTITTTSTQQRLAIKGPSVAKYQLLFDSQQQRFQLQTLQDAAGFFLTSDRGECHGQELKVIGRSDAAILKGGVTLNLLPIENALEGFFQQGFLAVPVSDERFGENYHLFCGASISQEVIENYLLTQFTHLYLPKSVSVANILMKLYADPASYPAKIRDQLRIQWKGKTHDLP